ncbi:hypothetical protein FA13DRAFT_1634966 [Coprinellus micaceus]|uniref:DUF1996 domain-containing protein n=1 Tax=Coprinellus micaceus TaxID=71717 RepID=A0A4Y7T0Q1_COPMI|nr:hypothetical protein FA13DRAFT_1634966 [Coprinellus micaceus]
MGASTTLSYVFLALSMSTAANAYWLMGMHAIAKERIDPIVNPGTVSGHTHIIFGGSNFGVTTSTEKLQQSECTSTPIKEDKSNYWAPLLYFQWANGSFSSLDGGAVVYYLFPDKAGTTTAFPKDFRMISGTPTKRTYNAADPAQKAVDYLCLDFNGQTTRHPGLPEKFCPSGIRSQINFPSCWDGKNVDSPDHKSHVAFRSGGPDSGDCLDPKFPVSIPRVFMEIYWNTGEFDKYRDQAKNPSQPFVFSYGDDTGYGNHADVYNGWDNGVLQKAVDGCNCDPYGSPKCCAQDGKKLFTLQPDGYQCHITQGVNERTLGMLSKLPGNNPVQPAGKDATMYRDAVIPALIFPVYAYTGNVAPAPGSPVGGPITVSTTPASSTSTTSAAATTTSAQGSSTTSTAVTTSSTSAGSPGATSTTSTTVAVPTISKPVATPTSSSSTGAPAVTSPPVLVAPQPTTTEAGTVTTVGSPSAPSGPSVTSKPSQSSPGVKPPASTTTGVALPAKPSYTKICRTNKAPTKPGKLNHHHGKPRFSFKSHHKRYDFDVDDYYYVA